jgi:transposase-like protein
MAETADTADILETKKIKDGIEETLTYTGFPYEQWLKIRTNNAIERVNREIRRKARVAGCFPDGNSALMLVCARLRYAANNRPENPYDLRTGIINLLTVRVL